MGLVAGLFFDQLFDDLFRDRGGMLGLESLRPLDEIRDLLSALAADPLEMTRAVLRGHGLAALLADATEELRAVLVRGAGAALLADLLVELRSVLFADQAAAHAARLGHRHSTAGSARHGLLLSVAAE